MIRVAICDDDNIFVYELKKYIKDIQVKNNLNINVVAFNSSKQFEIYIQSGGKFDIVFLDIMMPDIDGVSVGRIIRSSFDTLIVYISSSNQYFVDLFDVKPFGFILKPINYDSFKKVFFTVYEELYNSNSVYEFKYNKANVRVKYGDIIYIKSYGRKVVLKTKNDEYIFYGKIKDVYEGLQYFKFMWIHKSYIVNYSHINEISYDYVVMSNGDKLDISERRKKDIRNLYIQISESSEVIED